MRHRVMAIERCGLSGSRRSSPPGSYHGLDCRGKGLTYERLERLGIRVGRAELADRQLGAPHRPVVSAGGRWGGEQHSGSMKGRTDRDAEPSGKVQGERQRFK